MYRSRRAFVPKFNWVRSCALPPETERHEGPFHARGFHDGATLTLSPSLTTAVVAIIAVSMLSLGVSVTIVVLSLQALFSTPA